MEWAKPQITLWELSKALGVEIKTEDDPNYQYVQDLWKHLVARGFIDNDKFKFILWSKSFKSIMRNGGEYPDVKEYTLIEMPDPICVIFTPKVH